MAFITINPTRYAVDAPLSTDLFSDIKTDLDFLNGVNTSAVDAGGSPLILNGSFEAPLVASSTTPNNWTFVAGTGGAGVDTTSDQNHGAQSFKITRDTTAGNSGGTLTSEFFNVSPSLRYQFRFMIKCNRTDIRNKVVINWFDAAQGALSSTTLYDDGASPTAPTSWTANAVLVTPVASAMFGKLVLTGGDSTVTPAATGNTFFDGFSAIVKPAFSEQTVYTSTNTLTVTAGAFLLKIRASAKAQANRSFWGGYSEKIIAVKPGDSVVVTISAAAGGTNTVVHSPSGTTITVLNSTTLVDGTASGGSINLNGGNGYGGSSVVVLEY